MEDINQNKRLWIYLIKSKGEKNTIAVYIMNGVSKEVFQYYFYKHQCDYMEKIIAGPVVKKEKRTYTRGTFILTNDIIVDTPLTNDDKIVFAKSKIIFDSLSWCNNFNAASIRGLKIIETKIK